MALYDYLFIVIADNRVRNWMFMADPVPLALIIILYLTAVFKIGPSLMLTRKPYDLKPLLAVYNLAMVVTCVTILYLYYKSGVRFSTLLACIDIDYTDDPNSMRILNIMWWTHVIKMVELIETWFFVLRKKESQISFLHVYHHTSTLFLTWVGVKYVGGGMVTFSYVLNHGVHVLMYFYYFLALFGPTMQRVLNPVKKFLTAIQMIQFLLMLGQCILSMIYSCAIPGAVLLMYVPNVALNLYLFGQFYRKSYLAKGGKLQ